MMQTAPYFFALLLACIPALLGGRPYRLAWVYYYCFLLLFVGLRHQVGSDWHGYLLIADQMKGLPFKALLDYPEFLYYLAVWISVDMGWGIYAANLLTTAIFLFGVFSFCAKQKNPWLCLVVSIPFLVIVVGMSANRQAAAIGLTLLLMAEWRTSKIPFRVLIIVLATLFHTSAVFLAILFVVDSRISVSRKILVSIAIGFIVLYFLGDSDSVERYSSSYVQGRGEFQAAGALQQILLNALPGGLFLLLYGRYRTVVSEYHFVRALALFSILLVPLAFVFSVAASRLSFYLFPVSLVALSCFPSLFSGRSVKLLIRYMVVLHSFVVLYVWLNYANHAYNHKPYSNLLLL